MTHATSDKLLAQLGEFVATQMGLHFPTERYGDLERGIRSAVQDFGFEDIESCIHWLVSSPLTKNQIETLASHLTVGETFFFRDKHLFETLEKDVFAEMLRQRVGKDQRLRIWSAGCCTGEEPYSIAILLNQIIPDLKNWHVTILATDINPRFLKKASEGTYTEWSFRDAPQWVKARHFRKKNGNCYEIAAEIKRMVTFAYLNLAEDAYPSLLNGTNAMDVIFCRNVLMYFAPEQAKRAAQNFHRALVDGGWLIVSPTEASHILFSHFATAKIPGTTLYRKVHEQGSQIGDQRTEDWLIESLTLGPGLPSREPHVPAPDPQLPAPDPRPQTPDSRLPTPNPRPLTADAQPQPAPYAVALALYEEGRYDEAKEKLQTIVSRDIADSKAMNLLARIHANEGRLADAHAWCEKAITQNKLDVTSHYLLATILEEEGQAGQAIGSLKRALYLDPDFVLAHFTLGNLTYREGRVRESGKHFANALSLLSAYRHEQELPEAEGMTAGRLTEVIRTMMGA